MATGEFTLLDGPNPALKTNIAKRQILQSELPLYELLQKQFPDYETIPYKAAFYEWTNSFTAAWPSLLRRYPQLKEQAARFASPPIRNL